MNLSKISFVLPIDTVPSKFSIHAITAVDVLTCSTKNTTHSRSTPLIKYRYTFVQYPQCYYYDVYLVKLNDHIEVARLFLHFTIFACSPFVYFVPVLLLLCFTFVTSHFVFKYLCLCSLFTFVYLLTYLNLFYLLCFGC